MKAWRAACGVMEHATEAARLTNAVMHYETMRGSGSDTREQQAATAHTLAKVGRGNFDKIL